jgi:hypothetical protein
MRELRIVARGRPTRDSRDRKEWTDDGMREGETRASALSQLSSRVPEHGLRVISQPAVSRGQPYVLVVNSALAREKEWGGGEVKPRTGTSHHCSDGS